MLMTGVQCVRMRVLDRQQRWKRIGNGNSSMTNILVTGGAGYIGSHTCLRFAQKGYTPVVLDNLVNGHREFVRWGPFEQADVRDQDRVTQIIAAYEPVAIVHFAGLIEVADSIINPIAFFENNVTGSLTLLTAAARAGIDKLVFSSTCATYGIPQQIPITETHPQSPINPYGTSKLMVEQILAELATHKGFRSVALRYFNAAGAEPAAAIGEWHVPETHVLPLAIEAARGIRSKFKVFGSDYPTDDGTCIRDFVHVSDLADAHIRAVEYLINGGQSIALNVGTGRGTSVRQLIEAVEQVSQRSVPVEFAARRNGDPPELIANADQAKTVLGWEARHDLKSIVQSAWQWHLHHSPATAES
jgi:UDP-glucose 4-epimerase